MCVSLSPRSGYVSTELVLYVAHAAAEGVWDMGTTTLLMKFFRVRNVAGRDFEARYGIVSYVTKIGGPYPLKIEAGPNVLGLTQFFWDRH